MKKYILGLTALSTFLLFSGCSDDGSLPEIEEIDEATEEAIVDFLNEDLDNIVVGSLDELGGDQGEANLGQSFSPFSRRSECVVVTHDSNSKTVTIDFGDSCVGVDGVERSGKIIVTYTELRRTAGAVFTTTFEDFFVNGHQIEGTRTLTNVTQDPSTERSFNVVIEGGKITFSDGSTRTYEADKTRTWAINSSQEVTLTVTGSSSGTNRNSQEVSMQITEPIVFKLSCRRVGAVVAVQGVRELTRDEVTVTLDYGDGTCDNEVTITAPDGTSVVVNVENRRLNRG